MTPLSRTGPVAPVRILHLGLGNFFRAHQAWYTSVAPDAAEWGIAAFTGRSVNAATALNAQNGLYTLLVRDADDDRWCVPESISVACAGDDLAAWRRWCARPETAVITMTVTEAAYPRTTDGALDETGDVLADVAALRAGTPQRLRTVPGRLAAGLAARRAAGGGPLAVVSCDNLVGNGTLTGRLVTGLAGLADPGLAGWIEDNVSFVSTMVDRITPATTAEDVATAAELTGRTDAIPVVTEPYHEWILAGRFPAGRPGWEAAGARFVDDVSVHEDRKLRLLNGGHSLLAYVGGERGHESVAQALTDGHCRTALQHWWDEAATGLALSAPDVADYRAALLRRWENPRLHHRLAQIAADGAQKIPVRIVPVLRAVRACGAMPQAAITVIAAWIRHLHGAGVPVNDAGAAPYAAAVTGRDVLRLLAPDLAGDVPLADRLDAALARA